MSENLNDTVTVLVEDASVITVPIDDTLQNSGEAADAKAVGDALALKADLSQVTGISVNGQSADNQGAILVDGGDIPVSGNDQTKIDVAIGALQAKAGETLPYATGGAETIKAHVDAIDAAVVKISEQTFNGTEQAQARANIGALGSADIANIGLMVSGTNAASMAVESGNWVDISTLSLDEGMWIMTGTLGFTASFTEGCGCRFRYVDGNVNFQANRSVGVSGGGVCTTIAVKLSGPATYKLQAWQASGSSKTASGVLCRAIRIA